MEIKIFENEKEIGKAAGQFYVDFINANPSCVLGLATGATPLPVYGYIAEKYAAGEVSLKDVKTFNLDEYCGIPQDDKNSYFTFMRENLFSKTDVNPANVGFLDGNADPDEESARYAAAIESAGGIDIQLLGIGRNGHIAFNEPGDEFTGEAWKVKLSESTIAANSIYFTDSEMPRYAMTMGIGSIMKAKKIILIATGENKAEAVRAMIEGPVTPHCPASVLQQHPDTVIYLDRAAASLLK